MHGIAGVVIVSGALMRYRRMVIAVRQGADVPYQRERQQEQQRDGHQRCPTSPVHGRKSTIAAAAA
jgi:hypothetical protein